MRQVTKEAPEGILLLGSRPFQENVAFGHSDSFGIDAQLKKHSCNQYSGLGGGNPAFIAGQVFQIWTLPISSCQTGFHDYKPRRWSDTTSILKKEVSAVSSEPPLSSPAAIKE